MRISPVEKIGYGLGDTASNIVWQTVMMFLAFFYTDVYGLSAAAMGTMFLVVRLFDAVTDPVMGAIADRTNTRWGKFRPYLLWLSIPYAAIAILAFTTPEFGPTGKLVYAYVTYALLMVAYTAINIPYCALGGVITDNTDERVSLNSYRFFLATAGGVLVASTTMPLVNWLGGGSVQKGYQLAIAVMATLAVFMFVASFSLTRERVQQVSDKVGNFRDDIRLLLKNDQWVIVSILTFLLLMPLVIRAGAAIYYMKWYVGREDLATIFLTIGMVAQMIGAAVATPLVKRLSKVKSYALIQGLIVIASVILYFVSSNQLILIFGLFIVIQFFTQMGSPILWAMMADTVDYGELKTERRITGLTFSGVLFSLKMGMALGGAILGWCLAYFHYDGDALKQTDQALYGILLIFTLIPAVGHLLVLGIVPRYKLTRERYQAIRAELDERKGKSLA